MTLWEYYLQYTGELLEGTRPCPAGISLTESEDLARAVELYSQIETMGIPDFVRACAQMDGVELPADLYADFSPDDVRTLLSQLPAEPAAEEPAPEADRETRSAYEVLLDCCCMEDRLIAYLMQVLREGDELGFFRLAQITARTEIQPAAFLAWMATLQERAPEAEQACCARMDRCFDRLRAEGRQEVMAALLSGDQKTFEAFRCEAPELMHVPEATFDWYAKNYLDRYYPIRVLMKANGIAFPGTHDTEGA